MNVNEYLDRLYLLMNAYRELETDFAEKWMQSLGKYKNDRFKLSFYLDRINQDKIHCNSQCNSYAKIYWGLKETLERSITW